MSKDSREHGKRTERIEGDGESMELERTMQEGKQVVLVNGT